MQEVKIKIYDYEELSERAKVEVRNKWLSHWCNPYWEEDLESWKEFKKHILYDVNESRDGTLSLTVYDADTSNDELIERYKHRIEKAGISPTGYCMDDAVFGYASRTLNSSVDIVEWMNDVRYHWECAFNANEKFYSSEEAMIDQFKYNEIKFLENGQEFNAKWEVNCVQV